MEVKYDCVSSDHLPLCFSLYVKLLPSPEATIQEQIHAPHPVWNAASPQDLHNYHTQTGLLLSAIDVPHEVLRCTNPNCNDEAHRTLLSNLYNDIIKSAEVIPTKANNTSSKYTVLGWNDLVRDSHQATRESFLSWRSAGSPRHGPLYDIMKVRRAHFKRNKRLCEKNAEILKAERLASKLCNNDFKNFWKDIKHMNNARLPNPSNVGGASGVENVKNMWLHHYQSLLNSTWLSSQHQED